MLNYYIASGEENKMFTLRCRYAEKAYNYEGVAYTMERDVYCVNLSINAKKALEKARKYVAKEKNATLNEKGMPDLEEIRRRSEEELAREREIERKIQAQREQEKQERCTRDKNEKIATIKNGKWPFGKYKGEKFVDTVGDASYIQYMGNKNIVVNDNRDISDSTVFAVLQQTLKETFPNFFNLPKPNQNHFGNIKEKVEINVTLVKEIFFETQWGVSKLLTFVKDSGECIVYKGTSDLKCELGEQITMKCTIKSHNTYKYQAQTFVTRPKLLS